MSNQEIVIKVLGSAQDAGVPHIYCQCEHCQRAISNPQFARFAASLAVVLPQLNRWHLVDATPDICEQIQLLRTDFPQLGEMSSVLLTHAHMGHYTGLMFLGKEAICLRDIPVYAGAGMAEILRQHVPWKQMVEISNICIRDIREAEPFSLEAGLTVTPIEVPHRNEYSETFGFLFAGPSKTLLYIPDIDRWEQWGTDLKEIAATVDYCLLDGTFYSLDEFPIDGRGYDEIPHPLIEHTVSLLQDLVQSGTTKVFFTHLHHTNPVVDPDSAIRRMLLEKGFYVADEGLEIPL